MPQTETIFGTNIKELSGVGVRVFPCTRWVLGAVSHDRSTAWPELPGQAIVSAWPKPNVLIRHICLPVAVVRERAILVAQSMST